MEIEVRQIKKDSVQDTQTEIRTHDTLIEKVRLLSVNEKWALIEKKLASAGSIRLVPANSFEHVFQQDGFASSFKGMPSPALHLSLAEFPAFIPNLWYSSYQDPAQKFSFGFLRSGTVSRFGETNPESRQVANKFAAELLINAVTMLEKTRPIQKDGNLSFVSIDLQSPESEGVLELETRTTKEQHEALMAWNGKSVIVGDTQKEIEVFALNFPVHERSFKAQSGWDLKEETIEQVKLLVSRSFSALPPDLQEYSLPVFEGTLELIKAEESAEVRPLMRYALAARVILFASLAGEIAHFNCRSGKDRTGFLDVETKFAAYQIYRLMNKERISAAAADNILPEEAQAWTELLFEAGNHEIQQLNTGHPGSKLNQPSIQMRVGEKNWELFLGDAHLASM